MSRVNQQSEQSEKLNREHKLKTASRWQIIKQTEHITYTTGDNYTTHNSYKQQQQEHTFMSNNNDTTYVLSSALSQLRHRGATSL